MKNKILVGTLVLILISFIFVSLFRGSYANVEEDNLKLDLYDNNIEILREDILEFISLVDDYIFINSSFNMSDKLNENYDFLTNFVISFVIDNQEYFDINENKYITLDTFYDITYKIFGVEYYYILNEDIVIDDNIMLIENNYLYDIDMKIDMITDIVRGNNYYDVYVKYLDNDIEYVYRFDIIDNNRLVISNLSIGD